MANRSATLYYLNRHRYALEDIKEASQFGYPKELFYKLEERRAKCLLALEKHDDAIKAFRGALKALDDAKLTMERKQKFEMDIRIMLDVMNKGKQLNENVQRKNPPRIKERAVLNTTKDNHSRFIPAKERNPFYPACSNAVEIRDDKNDIGRHAVAARKITPGEVLIVERPYCAFLLAENRYVLFWIYQCV